MLVQQIRDYHSDRNIQCIADAILDKSHGLGLLWASADFPAWFSALDEYPGTWVISQHRDWLRSVVLDLGGNVVL